MGVKLQSALGGSVELNAPSTASNFTMTVPAGNGTVATTDQLTNFRNKIINGGFDIWQRGTSFSLTTTTYTADRFQVYATSSGSVSRSTDIPSNLRSKYSISVTSDQWANGILQIIEDLANYVNGKTYTISFWAKGTGAAVGKTFKISVGWAPEDSTFKTLSSDWQYYTRTITFASNFRSTNGGGDHLYVHAVRVVDGATLASGNNILITQLQMEEGSVATPFEQRPIGTELSLCQRYYQTFGGTTYAGIATASMFSTTGGIFSLQYFTPMRVAPSIGVTNLIVTDRTVFDNDIAISAITAGLNNAYLRFTNTPATPVGNGGAYLIAVKNGTTGSISASAEL